MDRVSILKLSAGGSGRGYRQIKLKSSHAIERFKMGDESVPE